MSTPTVQEETVQAISSPMTAYDRCDRCGAQAFVRASKGSMTLLFCGHHGAANLDSLVLQEFEVDDFRQTINVKASQSSA